VEIMLTFFPCFLSSSSVQLVCVNTNHVTLTIQNDNVLNYLILLSVIRIVLLNKFVHMSEYLLKQQVYH
jgi:hypothetical protein